MRRPPFMLGELKIEHLVIGPIETNVYIMSKGEEVVVIDPADECDCILSTVAGRHVQAILLTHAHFDHMGAAAALRKATGAPVMVGALDAPNVRDTSLGVSRYLPAPEPCEVDRELHDGDQLDLLGYTWHVLHTPGHTRGSVCYHVEAADIQAEADLLVAGDTLFYHSHGRTDFEGGSAAQMQQSLLKLRQLPPVTLILPGHGEFSEIAEECTHGVLMLG